MRSIQESVKAFIPWMNENTDGWNMIDMSKMQEAFDDAGFTTGVEDRKYGPTLVVTHPDHEGELTYYGRTFEDRLNGMKYSGPFWLIDPDVEDAPKYFYMTTDKPVTTFDDKGSPKVRKGSSFYGVLSDVNSVPWGDPWLNGSPEHKQMISVDGGNVAGSLAYYLLGFSPGSQYMGRGFSQQADARAIVAFSNGEVVEKESR